MLRRLLLGFSLFAAALPVYSEALEGVALKGAFDVGASGAATYSIPIKLPAGPAGFTPSLSLGYSSQGGNGLLGQGWSLNGLSAISRCPLTKAQDGRSRAVAFDAEDGLCLDGARLVFFASSSGVNGYTEKEYRTEIESFSKVVAYIPSNQTDPQYIKVWRKDGLIDSYGNTPSSRVEVGLTSAIAREWRLNRREDRRGNYMDVQYVEDQGNGEVYPQHIEYGANSAVVQQHLYRIIFDVEARTDLRYAYSLGNVRNQTKRLKTVNVYKLSSGVLGELVSSNGLQYEYASVGGVSGASRIKSIQRCDVVGGVSDCLPSTLFSWYDLPGSFNAENGSGLPSHSMTIHGKLKGGLFADVNNDGKPDYIQSINGVLGYNGWGYNGATNNYYLNRGNTQFDSGTSSGAQEFLINEVANGGVSAQGGLKVLDINSDGFVDIIGVTNGVIVARCGRQGVSGFEFVECTVIPSGQTAQQAWLFAEGEFVRGVKDGGMQVADINADGILDFIVLSKWGGVSVRKVYIGGYRTDQAGGYGRHYYWYESPGMSSTLPQSVYFSNEGVDQGLRLFDIDGDGRLDIVRSSQDGVKAVYLNKWSADEADDRVLPNKQVASATFVEAPSLAATIPIAFVGAGGKDHGARMLDINGDGLVDIIRTHVSTAPRVSQAYLNTGNGFAGSSSFASSQSFNVNYNGYDGGVRFADVNADGLVDAIELAYVVAGTADGYGGTAYPQRNIFLNTGASFVKSGSYSASVADLYISFMYVYPSLSMDYFYDGAESVDINGDGLLDLVQMNTTPYGDGHGPYPDSGPTYQRRYQLQNAGAEGSAANKIKSICDGLNNCTAVQYKPLTDSSVYESAFDAVLPNRNFNGAMHVVSRVEVVDASTAPQVTSDYSYKKSLQNIDGRGSLGFAERVVKTTVPVMTSAGSAVQVRTQATQYSQEWPYVGMVKSQTLYIGASNSRVQSSEATFGLKSCIADEAFCVEELQISGVQQDKARRYLPYVKQHSTQEYRSDTGVLLATKTAATTLDRYGNATQIVEQVVGLAQSFVTSKTNDYVSDESSWQLSRLERSTVNRVQPEQDDDLNNDNLTTTTEYSYYPASTSNNFEGLLQSVVVEPGSPLLKQTKGYTYNVFGNITSTSLKALGQPDRITQHGFDPTGRFQQTETNAKGHVEARTFDMVLGAVKTQTDANNGFTTWSNDAAGRTLTVVGVDDLDTALDESVITTMTYKTCTTGCLPNARYMVTATTPGVSPVVTYYDSQSREVGSRIQSLDGSYVYIEQVYNGDGSLWRKSRPYFSGDTKYWTSYEYDELGRIKKIMEPSGNISMTYAGFDVITDNAKSQQRIEHKNVLRQLVQVTDASNKVMTYNYDALGNLSRTVDAKGNAVVIKHDLLGRKVEMQDPDLGLWTYERNGFGELVKQTDARGKTITLGYDELGRLKTKTALGDMVSTWTYDDATIANGVGRVSAVATDTGYQRVFSGYDIRGHALTETTRIAGVDYALTSAHDSLGRLTAMLYPGEVGYKNDYDPVSGYLAKVKDYADNNIVYWQAKAMDAEGHLTEAYLNNGLTTQRVYQPDTGLLESVRTGVKGTNGLVATVQDDSYSYDAVGNLSIRVDNIALSNEYFDYDSINRLTSAQVDGLNAISVTYDEIGNITSKSDVGSTYTYNPSGVNSVRPHAVTSTSGGPVTTSFTYDANGNMLTGNGRTYLNAQGQQGWNSFNKPVSIVQGNVTETFLYDADFERVKRTTTVSGSTPSSSSIIYLNPRLDMGGTYEKETKTDGSIEQTYHLYAGNVPIAAIVAKSGGIPTKAVRYFHEDHLGSIAVTTNESGAMLERLSYDPWGKRRELVSTSVSIGTINALTLPAAAEDPNRLIVRDATTGYVAFHTNSIRTSWPQARAQAVPVQQVHKVSAVLQTGLNRGKRRNFELAVENTAGYATANYRRYGVVMKGNTLYRNSCIGGVCDLVSLGVLSDNATYTAELVTSGETAKLTVVQNGVSGGFADAIFMDWMAAGAVTQKRIVSGPAKKINPLVLPMVPMVLRWPDAPVVMQALAQAEITVQNVAATAESTRHGFTGHEMLDGVALVHMNGRVYDPSIGRFLSPDPNVFNPDDMQDFSRYSYVLNNPLNAVDPSGFQSEWTESQMVTALTLGFDEPGDSMAGDISAMVGQGRIGQIAPVGTPVNFSSPMSTQSGESRAALGLVVGVGQIVVPGAYLGSAAWDAAENGDYLDAIGYGVLAAGEVGLTVASVGTAQAILVPMKGALLAERIVVTGGPKASIVANTATSLSQGQQRAITKIDNILSKGLKDHDITGMLKDMAGTPVAKPGGGAWDHLKEVNDFLRGLRSHVKTLEGVADPVAQAARQRALGAINRIESAIQGHGI